MKQVVFTFPNGSTLDVTNSVSTGFSYVEKLDYELDFGTMILPFITREIPFPIFTTVDIYDDTILIQSMRIQDDFVEISSKSPLLYRHTISLIEHTKVLEKIYISGKTFTQPLDGVNPKTLLDVIEELIEVTPFQLESLVGTNRPINNIVNSAMLDTVISPEFTFNNVNLREALNEIYSYIDAVPRLDRNNNLTFDFFNEIKTLIDDENGVVNHIRQQNIEFYATNIISDVLNPISDEDNMVTEIYPSQDLFISARSKGLLFNADEAIIPTPKKIYELINIFSELNFSIERQNDLGADEFIYNAGGTIDTVFPLNRNVVEKALYDTLPTYKTDASVINLAKENTNFYTYGEKNIDISQTTGVFDIDFVFSRSYFHAIWLWAIETGIITPSSLENFKIGNVGNTATDAGDLINIGGDLFPREYIISTNPANFVIDTNLKDFKFRIEYLPIPDTVRIDIDREDITDVNLKTETIINQRDRILDINNFMDNMYGKVNKMGNVDYQLSHRVRLLSNSYNIGDYTEDKFIITGKETIFFKDYYFINYELTRNFNKLSEFVGINSQVRQWEIGETGRTLERYLNYKEYIELRLTPVGRNEIETLVSTDTILETFDKTVLDAKNINYGIFRGISGNVLQEYVLTPIQKAIGGNNISFSFEFQDNKSAGNYLDDDDPARLVNNFVPYTDEVGKLDTFELRLFHDIGGSIDTSLFVQTLPIAQETFLGDEIVEGNFRVNKDNREVIKMNLQYQFLGNDDIIIGEQLTKGNNLIIEDKETLFKCYIFDDRTFSQQRLKNSFQKGLLDGYKNLVNDVDIIVNYTNRSLTINTGLIDLTTQSYVITDSNDNVYFAVNSNYPIISFNFLNQRDNLLEFTFKPFVSAELGNFNANVEYQFLETYFGEITATLGTFNANVDGDYSFKILQGEVDVDFDLFTANVVGDYGNKIYVGDVTATLGELTATLNYEFFELYVGNVISTLGEFSANVIGGYSDRLWQDLTVDGTLGDFRGFVEGEYSNKIYVGDVVTTFDTFNANVTPNYLRTFDGDISATFNDFNANIVGNYSQRLWIGNEVTSTLGTFTANVNYTYLQPAFDYLGTATQPFDFTENYLVQGTDQLACPTASQVENWFNANFDASSYNIGDIIRIRTFVEDNGFPVGECDTHYFEVILA